MGPQKNMGIVTSRIVLWFLNQYRRFLSPFLPSACRFHPSCSQYAADCFRAHGIVQGFWLLAKRLLRCHPYCDGGLDPVPGTQ